MDEIKLARAQAYFQQDTFATENGAVITEISDTTAECRLKLTAHHKNAMGNVMGGVLFMLADFAFAVIANTDRPTTVSADSTIHFLRNTHAEELIARAELIRVGKTSVYGEISVSDNTGALLARVSESGIICHARKESSPCES